MELEILRGPFILYETINMLYKFVNGLTFRSLLNQRVSVHDDMDGEWAVRYAEQLQAIMDESCAGLNPTEPELQYFFGRTDVGKQQEGTCLAHFMTTSFCSLQETDIIKSVDLIRSNWRHMQAKNAWVSGFCTSCLVFSYEEGGHGDLLDQICALELPPEFQLKLYKAFRDMDSSLDRLVALIHPIARQLEKAIVKANWILEERVAYWKNSAVDLGAFLTRFFGEENVSRARGRTTLAVSLMNFDQIVVDIENHPNHYTDRNHLYFGCLVSAKSGLRSQGSTFTTFGATLKVLGDKKRLDLLYRLSKERSYCQELAESMGMDPSNMSRNLAMLYNYGFLRQEREAQKCYYRTEPAAVRRFLRQLENILLN